MARRFFRAQFGKHSFEAMQQFASADGGDGLGEQGGICACDSVTQLRTNTIWGGWKPGEAEVVVFEARVVCEIYDGYRVEPLLEIARFDAAEFQNMIDDESAYELE